MAILGSSVLFGPSALVLDGFGEEGRNLAWTVGHGHIGRLEGGDLGLRGPEVARDDGAGMAQGLARRGVTAADEGHDRSVGQMLGDEGRGITS